MDQSSNQPVEIDIKDLFCYVLKKSLVIIIVAVVCAAAGIGYAWFKNRSAGDTIVTNVLNLDERLPGETDDEYSARSTKVNQARSVMQSIESLSNQVEVRNRYLSESILMQVDPANVAESNAQVVISLTGNQPGGSLEAVFAAYKYDILHGSYLDEASEAFGYSRYTIGELITVDESFDEVSILEDNQILVMNIKVVGLDTEFTFALTDFILTEIDNVSADICDSVANHTVSLAGRQNELTADTNVRTSQYDTVNYLNNLQVQINNENNILDNLAKQLGISDRSAFYDPSSVDTGSSSLKSIAQFGAIGLIVGAFLIIAFYALIYMFGHKMVSQNQFFSMFSGIKKIGVCKPSGNKSAFVSLLDRLTEDDNKLTQANSDSIISANVRNLTLDKAKILITGTVANDEVKKKIKDLKLSGDVRLNVFENPDILRDVSSYDGIVIVEQRGESEKKRVREQIELLNNSGKTIIGAIIV
ncbi:MAG: hypothetical protein K6F79_00280 [Saccharofermentans sp.]|nr:hypothetical protein [Saccharofermentans sp.]